MPSLYLVRHAQASFGADNYDQLSQLGQRQSVQLGRYFARRKFAFDQVVTGTLKRHEQTLAGVRAGMAAALPSQAWPGLNEYNSQAVVSAIHAQTLDKPTTPELFRQHFRLLRQGLLQWMLGHTQPVGMPSWEEFRQGVVDVLTRVQQSDAQNVLLVSSGGPIACALAYVLATPPAATIELNMRLRNTAVSELIFTPKRFALQSFNSLAHLERAKFARWITHA